MPRFRSTAIRHLAATLVGVLGAVGLVGTAGPTSATASATVHSPVATSAVFGPSNFGANSGNWAGWVAAGHHTSVTSSWRQPAVTCAAHENSDSAFWVGLDGYGSASVEQVGAQSGCANGHAFYSAWTEFYPAPATTMANPLRPGDALRATVTFVSGHTYRLVLVDSTRGWSKTVTGTASKSSNASVEIVAEAPTNSSTRKLMALSHFSAVRFTAISVDGTTFSRVSGRQQLIMGTRARVMASTSSIDSSQSFTVSWHAAVG